MMEIILELFDPQQCSKNIQCLVYSIKILPTGRPVAKTLIEYNNNKEEKDEEENEPIDLEFIEQKTNPYNFENAIDFK